MSQQVRIAEEVKYQTTQREAFHGLEEQARGGAVRRELMPSD